MKGFTLIEIMISLAVTGIGLLALASTSGFVVMQVGGGAQRMLAAALVQSVFDSIAATPCAVIVSGRDSSASGAIAWTVSDTAGAKLVQQVVAFPTRRGMRSERYVSMIACPAR